MTSLKEVLDSLTVDQRATLSYAFEHDIVQHVLIGDGQYVGVNVEHVSNFTPILTGGKWSYGNVKVPASASR